MLWPSPEVASQAFQAWKAANPTTRASARPFDLALPVDTSPELVDYDVKAHELGIHLPPGSNYPFTICVGFLFLFLALVPFPNVVRVISAGLGAIVFLVGVGGWWLVEDIHMYEETERASQEGQGH